MRTLEGKAMAEYVSDGTSVVRREPIGVVGHNSVELPSDDGRMESLSSTCDGNTVIMKPASYTPLTTLELASLMENWGAKRGHQRPDGTRG